MTTFLLTLLVLLLVVAGMAVGIIFSNKPIKGSCGGMSSLGFNTECDICGGDTNKCEKEQAKNQKSKKASDLAYEVSENKNK